ncbi:MAG: hypothetical protein AAGF84_02425 [Planctomycetota bacterium]
MNPLPAETVEATESREALRCVGCGYRLRGTTADHCPECGLSVEQTRAKLRGFPPSRNYTAELHRVNVACIVLPTVIITATFVMMRLLGIHELAWTAALLSVLAVVFSPIAALVTMPWRSVYEDATAYRLRWRITLLAAQWLVLLGIGLWALIV